MSGWGYALLIVMVIAIVWLVSVYMLTKAAEKRIEAGPPAWMAAALQRSSVSQVGAEPASVDAATAPAQAPGQPETAEVSGLPVVSSNDKPADAPKEGFCPKLMHRAGFCDAGESMNSLRGTFQDLRPSAVLPGGKTSWLQGFEPERFMNQPGRGTVWDGVMTASNLPI
jgi:hypothetical protein